MKWTVVAGASMAAVVAGLAAEGPAHASLTTSQIEEVRGYVATEAHPERVRALLARPDVSADEGEGAMAAALASVPLDAGHAEYLEKLVLGAPSDAARPLLAVAVVRGMLAHVAATFDERGRAFAAVDALETSPRAGLDDAARAECARALVQHFVHDASLMPLDRRLAPAAAQARAQGAWALLDAMPSLPVHRVDAADALGLTGARRSIYIDRGLLVLGLGGDSAGERMVTLRRLLERLPGAVDGVEGVFVGDPQATFRARGPVLALADETTLPKGAADLPWGRGADATPIDASVMAMALGLAHAAVDHALAGQPSLRAQVEQDGAALGSRAGAGRGKGVEAWTAMLAVDAPRAVGEAAARLSAGDGQGAAWLADALGALAVDAPTAGGASGVGSIPVGGGSGDGPPLEVTRVRVERGGAVSAFSLGGHAWRIVRSSSGRVASMECDGARAASTMRSAAVLAPAAATSWRGAGLIFARLAGAPRAAIGQGGQVRLDAGRTVDAIVAPAPGDDAAVEADLRVTGGPAGVVLRALPERAGFTGVSLLIVPGSPARAQLSLEGGAGDDATTRQVVTLPSRSSFHVRFDVRGSRVKANVGGAVLNATLPPGSFAHGDAALCAYPGASIEASRWRVFTP